MVMRRAAGTSADGGLDTSSAGLSVSREAAGAAASGFKIEQAERLSAAASSAALNKMDFIGVPSPSAVCERLRAAVRRSYVEFQDDGGMVAGLVPLARHAIDDAALRPRHQGLAHQDMVDAQPAVLLVAQHAVVPP